MTYAAAPALLRTTTTRPVRRPSARVARRRRLVAAVVVGLLLIASVVLLAGWLGRADTSGGVAASRPVTTRYHVVEPGDTLWSIALKYHPNDDVRPQVQRWMAQREGRALQPGERIAVP